MKYPLTRAQVFVLAEMAGVCESTVRRYLRGDRSFERAADAIQGALKRPRVRGGRGGAAEVEEMTLARITRPSATVARTARGVIDKAKAPQRWRRPGLDRNLIGGPI